jgi:spore maturation protein B
MNALFSLTMPLIIALVAFFAIFKKVDVYGALIAGAGDGLRVLFRIAPAVIAMFAAISMLRATGFIDLMSQLLSPVLQVLGIPPECMTLMIIKPLSGSGALAVGGDIIQRSGPDTVVGRTAAVMLGSSETVFYTIAVYFGAARVKQTRYAIPAALIAELVCFIVSALTVRLLY